MADWEEMKCLRSGWAEIFFAEVWAKRVDQGVAGVGELEKLPGPAPTEALEIPLIWMGDERLVGGEKKNAGVLADRDGGDELAEGVEVEFDAEDAAQPSVPGL